MQKNTISILNDKLSCLHWRQMQQTESFWLEYFKRFALVESVYISKNPSKHETNSSIAVEILPIIDQSTSKRASTQVFRYIKAVPKPTRTMEWICLAWRRCYLGMSLTKPHVKHQEVKE